MDTIKFDNAYILDSYSIVGKKENEKNIKYDEVIDDFYYECKTFELAEVKMQKRVIDGLIKKTNVNINLVIGGDLYNQIAISSMSMKNNNIPFLGIYSACSTFIEGMILASKMLDENFNNILVLTSSHNLNSEKQFRYPIEYGAVRKKINTITATGSVGCIITNKKTNIKINSGTIGSVIDKKVFDVNNMGAVMAGACAEVIKKHLDDTKKDIDYYDLVLTGDLGVVGSKILKDYLKYYNIILKKHIDAGSIIYKDKNYAGASGPSCLPLILFNKILKEKKYKKILVVGTGSLHTKILVDQKNSIPAISHAISLEVIK